MCGNKNVTALVIWSLFTITPALLLAADDAAVTVQEDRNTFTLSNGIVTARILKRSGDIRSLRYKGTEILTDRSGHAGGYWSHDTTGGTGLVTKVTIDPTKNGGERAEVSVKGISGGKKMGHGPGAAADGDFPADIEIRYSLGRGDSGIYTYCIFDHLPEYGSATMTEARFAAKLADFFDWMSIDERRNKHYPKTLPGEDKYVYTALQSENRAFGFIGESKHNKDWFFAHVPHNVDPDARVVPFHGVSGKGRATPYTIRFQMKDNPSGRAVLRMAICGTGARSVGVSVNDNHAGQIAIGPGEGVITRH